MKYQNKARSFFILIAVLALIITPISAKTPTGIILASSKGKMSYEGVDYPVRMQIQLEAEVEGDPDIMPGSVVTLGMRLVLPKTSKTLVLHALPLHIEVNDEGFIQAFMVELNDQFLEVKSVLDKNGKTQWVTENADLLVNGKDVVLNMVWKLSIVLEDYQINNVPE
jgi:hypothetical protein